MVEKRDTKSMNCGKLVVIKIQFTIAIEISNFTVIAAVPNERRSYILGRGKTIVTFFPGHSKHPRGKGHM